MAGGDLHGGAVLAVPIHEGAKGKISLNGHGVALVEILRYVFRQPSPCSDAIEDRDIAAVGVLLAGIGSLCEGGAGDVVDVGKHRVSGQPSCRDNQIHAHVQASLLGVPLNAS